MGILNLQVVLKCNCMLNGPGAKGPLVGILLFSMGEEEHLIAVINNVFLNA